MIQKKILILGSTGMLGHAVTNYFLKIDEYRVFNASFKNMLNDDSIILDVLDNSALEDCIYKIKPDIIINCIGVLIKGSNNIENSIYINACLPHILKRIIKNTDSRIIHISTDCVFSGKNGNYKEDDLRDGDGTYAKTKILGEIIDEHNITIRTSIIGPEIKSNGEGLFNWFMSQSASVNGYLEAYWSGVTTIELARAIKWAIDNNITGLYHVTNNQSISKNDLLRLFKKYTKKNIEIIPLDLKNIDKSFIDTRKLINYEIPSYESMVKEMVELVSENKELYPQYHIG